MTTCYNKIKIILNPHPHTPPIMQSSLPFVLVAPEAPQVLAFLETQ